ncbi:erythritol ABC transporter ATP-binding protein [Pseudoxanthobacter soli DSM 19599]|uniref:Erythritol ABC transporter ATP-binding protein n=1 Tax=Pseudoxanthobacter soli DSM 19599 TaxID=1123029 RepID=A0A1M7ZR65_9HYPH|nr:sugar ABC transporter ATP-binding protein [Pseudoxanthobacter soli]SHO67367.1 erythritol ABC transporter ATP-binding protein [Pseudoxanthobacter soli DSM 19599]
MSASEPQAILRAERITKTFPGTVALKDVDFTVHAGAVNVLIGENGAGKSTLMKILAGVERPTSGTITLEGQPVSFASVHDAARKGIGIVFQELNLCPNLSVTDNIFLGRDLTVAGFHIDRVAQRARTSALLKRLEADIDPDTLVGDLMIGQQQIVEIAKALAEDARVLIMDEPTSALSVSEVEVLFRVIEDLKRSGVSIIYISHRLEELIRIGDHFTVLRDGRLQAAAPKADVSIPWIIRQMLGADNVIAKRPPAIAPGEAVLRVEGLSVPRRGGLAVEDVTVSFRAGEITAIYGLLGAGRTELFETLYGVRQAGSGSVTLNGREIGGLAVSDRLKAGIILVPEDRQRDGLVQNLSVGGNLGLSSLRRFTRFLSISKTDEAPLLKDMVKRLHIKTAGVDAPITSLSGGNQQKVVIGRTLLTRPTVLLLDEPSRGIDIGAKAEVFSTMRDLADAGLAVVYTTSDLKETHAVADRILVMAYGRITADFPADAASDEAIVLASTHKHPSAAPAAA